jgi:hypothetical protein
MLKNLLVTPLHEIIMKAAKKNIPRGRVKPFWNEELKKLMEERNKARRNAETLQTPEAMEICTKESYTRL